MLGAAAPALAQAPDFPKIQSRVTKVAGNVYMIDGTGGFAGGNIGVSVGEDGVLIVDDQFAPLAPKIQAALNDRSKSVKGSRVHVLGVAYKRDINDVRESPALDVMALLNELGAQLSYSDPFIPSIEIGGLEMEAVEPLAACRAADCVVLITDHGVFDYKAIAESSKLIVDTRNALRKYSGGNVVRL